MFFVFCESSMGECTDRTILISSQITNMSLLQDGGKAAFSPAGLLYAVKGWSPEWQVQTVMFRRHDTLSLP